MTIQDMLKKGIEILKNAGIETPAVEAGVLLCHVLGCDRVFIYTHGQEEMEPEVQAEYLNSLQKRATGMPLQYITGKREFMSLEFQVAPGVLVPRHETELLVETVIRMAESADKDQELRILDIGTGSGCIAVSLAKYIERSRVTAVDISETALMIAKSNAEKHGVAHRVEFVLSDLFSSVQKDKQYDIIVSNPPYIPEEDMKTLPVEVREYEPRIALAGGEDGLLYYRRIIRDAPCYLKNRGWIAFETGINQAPYVLELLRRDFTELKTFKDLAGIDRVVTGRLKKSQ